LPNWVGEAPSGLLLGFAAQSPAAIRSSEAGAPKQNGRSHRSAR
jgi:hypothetical protein